MKFGWLRERFKSNDADVWASLDRGRAVLASVDQLNNYLWTYGPMIEAQWQCAAGEFSELQRPARVIDYGCGQGIGGLLLNETTEALFLSKVAEIILIEPSTIALARAEAIYKILVPQAVVSVVPKTFDAVRSDDIPGATIGRTLHLFSNTLDVSGYKPLRLLGETLRSGPNTILAVSHDREHDGGTTRFHQVKAALEHPKMVSNLTVQFSTLEQFKCGPADKWDAVLLRCDVEVPDG